jgi:hypothetical protein
MMRFLSLNWSKLSVLAVFYGFVVICLGQLADVQIDAMKTQADALQFVQFSTADGQ